MEKLLPFPVVQRMESVETPKIAPADFAAFELANIICTGLHNFRLWCS